MWKDARDVNVSLDEMKKSIRDIQTALKKGEMSLDEIDIADKYEDLNNLVLEIKKIVKKSSDTNEYANYVSDVFLKISDDVLRETSRKFKRIEQSDNLINKYRKELLTAAIEINNTLKELNEVYGDYTYFNNLAGSLKNISGNIKEYEEGFKEFHNSMIFNKENRISENVSLLNNEMIKLRDNVNRALSFRKQLKLIIMNLKVVDTDSKKKDILVDNLESMILEMNNENDYIHKFVNEYKEIAQDENIESKLDKLLNTKKNFELLGKELRSIDTIVFDFWERIENLSSVSFDKRISLGDLSAEYEEAINELQEDRSDFLDMKDKKVKMILEKLNVLIDDTKLNSGAKSPVNPVYLIGDFDYNEFVKELFKRIEDLEDLIIQDKHSMIRSNLKAVSDSFNTLIQYENKKFSAVLTTESEMLINRNREFVDILDNLYNEEDYKNIDLLHKLMDFKRKFKRHLVNEDVEMWDKLP